MHILFTILLVIATIIVLLFIFGLFMKKEHYVHCETVINAPQQKVFDFVKLLKNQELYNKYAKADPNRHETYKGTDGTVRFTIAWNGNKDAGCGEKEIMNIVEGRSVEMEIRFVKPMKTSARIVMDTEALSANETKVSWNNSGTLPYPLNVFIPMFEKNFTRDLNSSLLTLKTILEK